MEKTIEALPGRLAFGLLVYAADEMARSQLLSADLHQDQHGPEGGEANPTTIRRAETVGDDLQVDPQRTQIPGRTKSMDPL